MTEAARGILFAVLSSGIVVDCGQFSKMDNRNFVGQQYLQARTYKPEFGFSSSLENWWKNVERAQQMMAPANRSSRIMQSLDDTSGYVSQLKVPDVPVNSIQEETQNDPKYTSTNGPPCLSAWSPYSKGGMPSSSSDRLPTTTYLHNHFDQSTPVVKAPDDYVVPMSRYRPPILIDRPPKDQLERTMDFALNSSFQEAYQAGMAPLRSRMGVGNVPIHSLFGKGKSEETHPKDVRDLTADDFYGKPDDDTSFWEQDAAPSNAPPPDYFSNVLKESGPYFPKPATVEDEKKGREEKYFPKPAASKRRNEEGQNVPEMRAFVDSLNKGAKQRTSTPLPQEPSHIHYDFDEQLNDQMLGRLRDMCRSKDGDSAPNYVKMTVKSMRVYNVDPSTKPSSFAAPLDEVTSIGKTRITANVTNRREPAPRRVERFQFGPSNRHVATATNNGPTIDDMRNFMSSPICNFCFKNGEPVEVYSTHITKMTDGTVTCPILQKYVCDICGATGTSSHTRSYCPKNPEGAGMRRQPAYRRLSNGVLTLCHNHK